MQWPNKDLSIDGILEAHDNGIIDLDNDTPDLVIRKLYNEHLFKDNSGLFATCEAIYQMLHKALGDEFTLPPAQGTMWVISRPEEQQSLYAQYNAMDMYETSPLDNGGIAFYNIPTPRQALLCVNDEATAKQLIRAMVATKHFGKWKIEATPIDFDGSYAMMEYDIPVETQMTSRIPAKIKANILIQPEEF